MTVRAVLSQLGRIAQWIITIVSVLLLTIYFGWAFESRRMLQLQPEHQVDFDSEFFWHRWSGVIVSVVAPTEALTGAPAWTAISPPDAALAVAGCSRPT